MGNQHEFAFRARATLGELWQPRLALALLCSQGRFERNPRPIVYAVLELLEMAFANEIPESALPARWSGSASVADGKLRERYAEIFGRERITVAVATFVELTFHTVRLSWSERRRSIRSGTELVAIVELLELLVEKGIPRDTWPARWQRAPKPGSRRKRTRVKLKIVTTGSISPRELERRARAALKNDDRANTLLATAVGLSPDHLLRIWREGRDSKGRVPPPQPYLLAVVELLETLVAEGVPTSNWPERWRTLHQAEKSAPSGPRGKETPH